MTHETTTALSPAEVLDRAAAFFTERAPHSAAFLEKRGPGHAVFRGQGGEELVIAAFGDASGTRVRASTLFFDQTIGRFLSTLPAVDEAAA